MPTTVEKRVDENGGAPSTLARAQSSEPSGLPPDLGPEESLPRFSRLKAVCGSFGSDPGDESGSDGFAIDGAVCPRLTA